MKEELLPERWRQLALAIFDYYVLEFFANQSNIINEDGKINKRYLGDFSKKISHNPDKVHSAIATSCGRFTKCEVRLLISTQEEELIIKDTIKSFIKESNFSLILRKRKLGELRMKINHMNYGLKMTLSEFVEFLKPLYIEAVEEVLSV